MTAPETARALVLGFFKGDEAKTTMWFGAPSPWLGNISPNQMIAMGRAAQLLRFIQDTLAEGQA